MELLENVPQYTTLIFLEDEIDKRLKLIKMIQKKGELVEFTLLSENDLKTWIARYFKEQHKIITRDAMDLIMEYMDHEMQQIIHELDKVIAFVGQREIIQAEDVKNVCTKSMKRRIFELFDAVSQRVGQKPMELLDELIQTKEPLQKIFIMTAKHFHQLLFALELNKEGFHHNEMAAKINVKPFLIKKLIHQAGRFGKRNLVQIVRETNDLDAKVKSGQLDSRIAIEILISTSVNMCKKS
jgi:DNA polymerase-3 subunit delta